MPLSTIVFSYWLLLVLFILFSFISSSSSSSSSSNEVITLNVGAIINADSRIGKEEKIAMEIAVQDFNNSIAAITSNTTNSSSNYKLMLFTRNSGGDPLRALATAEDLIEKERAQVILGLETWQETALVAKVANQAKVPVLSFSAPAITPPLTSSRWPFLLRMAKNDSLQIRCVSDIVGFYGWRRVIAIYEDDAYGGGDNSGVLALLSDALKNVSSEIEHWSAFPPFPSMNDPKAVIQEELRNIMRRQQSRVFIILQSSLQLATHLFTEAKKLGLMGQDSVWITTDSVTSLLDGVNSSVLLSMRGVIGIKTYFSETSSSFQDFSIKFQKNFRSMYPEEGKFEPGIHALRAYDAVSIVAKSIRRSNTLETLLQTILSSGFTGLSGAIQFKEGEMSTSPVYQIINVVQKGHIELGFWSPELGFSRSIGEDDKGIYNREITKVLNRLAYWPGGHLDRPPQGWVMPSHENPMKIGIPGNTTFEMFVKVEEGKDPTGFCIDIFNEATRRLGYELPHEFEPFNGTYDHLVDQVYLKTVSAVVGDITILRNRSNYVEFALPYLESGLWMIVPVKSEVSQKALMFTKPFTDEMWLVTGALFAYTTFIVWFLEHRSNPDFNGPWRNQLGTTLWFIFSTLFFAHRERLGSNFSKVVIVVWLFVVFVVTSSYTASLTSMLTVQQLEPTVTDIESLRRNNCKVGCDGDSFVREYLETVLQFDKNNIINVHKEYDYPDQFRSGNISAAFLEIPYGKAFLSTYCKEYKAVQLRHRFGGLSFVFPKGSPLAQDFSKAFLELSEDGTIIRLEKEWFKPSDKCSNPDTTTNNQRLGVDYFLGLFLLTGSTSTIVFLVYLIHLVGKFQREQQESYGTNISLRDDSLWNRTRRLVVYFNKGKLHLPERAPSVTSDHESPGHPRTSTSETEMSATLVCPLDKPRRLSSFASFPGMDRRVYSVI